ncbi:MAG: hypothetical protein ABF778_03390 [Liquorilactobacillus hordei]|uniref:hypothetical protein n=1 Tax=Liquorilactobacillus hordei TaxID=468911 RepID=UPI0039EAE81F
MSIYDEDLLLKNENFKKVVENKIDSSSINELFENTKKEVIQNIITQFGLSSLFDNFERGGGVDTIHNARSYQEDIIAKKNTAISDKLQKKLSEIPKYNSKTNGKSLHQTAKYKRRNEYLGKLKKSGKLIDAYTGKKLDRNQRVDLDHVISTKEIYEDGGRILAEIGADDLANSEINLQMTNRNLNRSKKEKSVKEYFEHQNERRETKIAEIEKIKNNSTLDKHQKAKKIQNINNILAADENRMKEKDIQARVSINKRVNKTYYMGDEFKKNLINKSKKQGIGQMKKQVVGVFIYEVQSIFFDSLMPILKKWNEYVSMKDRTKAFLRNIKTKSMDLHSRLKDIKILIESAIGGFVSGAISSIVNVLINTFLTTTEAFGKILCDGIQGIFQAIKVLLNEKNHLSKKDKFRQATEIIGSSVLAASGVIFSKVISNALISTPFVMFANEIGSAISAILTGFFTAAFIYSVEHFGDIVLKIKNYFEVIEYGIKCSQKQIEIDFQKIIGEIDDAYTKVLENINNQYQKLSNLQELLNDFSLTADLRLSKSVIFAEKFKVDDSKILKSVDEVDDYFCN